MPNQTLDLAQIPLSLHPSRSARRSMKKMKRRSVVLLIILGAFAWHFLSWKSPSIPSLAETAVITLREPYTGELIVKKTISDPSVIAALAESLSRAKSGSDHKCASIGTISFATETASADLEILPGHDAGRYEFRLDGELYVLARSSYIDSLVAAGIDREDIRLDGHPDVEQSGSAQPATAADSKSEGNEQPEPESEGRSQ
jgi:hypothetical protein